mmetsp:Transcript_11458/g.14184  ORF Transcript_11458/g.14184 Transcript_11458/m.14184 type:complete len:257 (+) Transcript_11458:116-886(+)
MMSSRLIARFIGTKQQHVVVNKIPNTCRFGQLSLSSYTTASTSNLSSSSVHTPIVKQLSCDRDTRFLSSSTAQSSSSGGFFSGMKQKFDNRMERKKDERTAEQFEKMAAMEVWTVQAFLDDLSVGLSSWRSKIPGMSNVKELQTTKRVAEVLKAVSAVTGPDATGEDLSRLGKKEKLKICIKAETSIEEVNGIIQQFEAMQMMHQMLRYRKKVGKPLPKDQAAMKTAMAEDSEKAFSKEQLKAMRMKMMKGKQRRR